MGLTVTNKKTIYIEDNAQYIKDCLVHEVGHYWDRASGMKSYNLAFQTAFRTEKNDFLKYSQTHKNNISNVKEYFAEVFERTILDPQGCKEAAPKSYQFVVNTYK